MRPPDPHAFHTARLREREISTSRLAQADRRLSLARLAIVGLTLGQAWSTWGPGWLSPWWLLVPAATFAGLIRAHERVIRAHETAERAVAWYARGLSRVEHRWAGSGPTGDRFLDDDHPYARDLDLFGEGSLFQLLDTAQTTAGEETLSQWLLTAAERDEIRDRQPAVADLAGRPQLREDLFTLGVDARRSVDPAGLSDWATAPSRLTGRWLRVVTLALGVGAVTSIGGWIGNSVPGWLPLGLVTINLGLGLVLSSPVSQVLHGSAEPARELVVLAAVFARLRVERYEAAWLTRRHAGLAERHDPVAAARQLDRYIQMHDWQHNMFFAPFAAVMLWGVQCALAVEAWRARHGPAVGGWVRVVGEFEAMAALGTYRFEHPGDPFPDVPPPRTPPVFDARDLAHPLLPRDQAVANDVCLGPEPQLLIVSGSNMSGKTTLLRTVGVNAVLAQAGAPVCAQSLRMTPVAIGGTLRVQDSLLSGRSKFYAEVLRVKQLVEITKGPDALLFLMDELFHGTNSHDRVEGAHGVLAYLVEVGAVGIVTTHDLALARVGDRLGRRAANVHFTDALVEGELTFDYRLTDGVATHGNALALMRAVGLDAPGPPDPSG